jgi:hypothetical protein
MHAEPQPDDVSSAESAPGDVDPTPEPAERTGVASVDEVLTQMDGLQERPVDEHVGVFEQAHERLRRALDASDG